VKGSPSRFRTSQGRIDQLDHILVPMTISIRDLPFETALRGYGARPNP
jgi:hypothetical protein